MEDLDGIFVDLSDLVNSEQEKAFFDKIRMQIEMTLLNNGQFRIPGIGILRLVQRKTKGYDTYFQKGKFLIDISLKNKLGTMAKNSLYKKIQRGGAGR